MNYRYTKIYSAIFNKKKQMYKLNQTRKLSNGWFHSGPPDPNHDIMATILTASVIGLYVSFLDKHSK